MNHIIPCHLCFLVLLIPRQTFSQSSDSSVDCFLVGWPLSGKSTGVHEVDRESLGKAALDISVWFVTWSWHSKASTSSSFSGKTRSSHSPDWKESEGQEWEWKKRREGGKKGFQLSLNWLAMCRMICYQVTNECLSLQCLQSSSDKEYDAARHQLWA